jgi:hypothetical protein
MGIGWFFVLAMSLKECHCTAVTWLDLAGGRGIFCKRTGTATLGEVAKAGAPTEDA